MEMLSLVSCTPILFKNDPGNMLVVSIEIERDDLWNRVEVDLFKKMMVRRAPIGTIFRSLSAMGNCDPAFIVKNAENAVFTQHLPSISQVGLSDDSDPTVVHAEDHHSSGESVTGFLGQCTEQLQLR